MIAQGIQVCLREHLKRNSDDLLPNVVQRCQDPGTPWVQIFATVICEVQFTTSKKNVKHRSKKFLSVRGATTGGCCEGFNERRISGDFFSRPTQFGKTGFECSKKAAIQASLYHVFSEYLKEGQGPKLKSGRDTSTPAVSDALMRS